MAWICLLASLLAFVMQVFATRESNISSLTCNFDSDNLCGWKQAPLDDTAWRFFYPGHAPQNFVGPYTGRPQAVSGKGHYIYVPACNSSRGIDSSLLSPVISTGQAFCLRFWFFVRGSSDNMLAVNYIRADPAPSDSVALWAFRRTGDQGPGWKPAALTTPSSKGNHKIQLVIQAKCHEGSNGIISFDDVSLTPGPCPAREESHA